MIKSDERQDQLKPMIIGHRGLTGTSIHENSAAAIEACARFGFDGVELDVQLTKDDVPIIWHDECIGQDTVSQMTLEECQKTAEYPLLTLKQALQLIIHLGLFFMCELKVYRGQVRDRLASCAMDQISQAKMSLNRYLICSFDAAILGLVLKMDDAVSCAFTFDTPIANIPSINLAAVICPAQLMHKAPVGIPLITYRHQTPPSEIDHERYAYVVDQPTDTETIDMSKHLVIGE